MGAAGCAGRCVSRPETPDQAEVSSDSLETPGQRLESFVELAMPLVRYTCPCLSRGKNIALAALFLCPSGQSLLVCYDRIGGHTQQTGHHLQAASLPGQCEKDDTRAWLCHVLLPRDNYPGGSRHPIRGAHVSYVQESGRGSCTVRRAPPLLSTLPAALVTGASALVRAGMAWWQVTLRVSCRTF